MRSLKFHDIFNVFCVLYASISLMLQVGGKTWSVSPTKRDLNTKMKYNNKLYYSQNCPHNKQCDTSLKK